MLAHQTERVGDSTNTDMLPSLPSKDHGQLLDVIDILRSQGISHYIPLPQFIFCGDQSSGKSSDLETISGVQFPIKDNLWTHFAMELIPRIGPIHNVALTIIPGKERLDQDMQTLLSFDRQLWRSRKYQL